MTDFYLMPPRGHLCWTQQGPLPPRNAPRPMHGRHGAKGCHTRTCSRSTVDTTKTDPDTQHTRQVCCNTQMHLLNTQGPTPAGCPANPTNPHTPSCPSCSRQHTRAYDPTHSCFHHLANHRGGLQPDVSQNCCLQLNGLTHAHTDNKEKYAQLI